MYGCYGAVGGSAAVSGLCRLGSGADDGSGTAAGPRVLAQRVRKLPGRRIEAKKPRRMSEASFATAKRRPVLWVPGVLGCYPGVSLRATCNRNGSPARFVRAGPRSIAAIGAGI